MFYFFQYMSFFILKSLLNQFLNFFFNNLKSYDTLIGDYNSENSNLLEESIKIDYTYSFDWALSSTLGVLIFSKLLGILLKEIISIDFIYCLDLEKSSRLGYRMLYLL